MEFLALYKKGEEIFLAAPARSGSMLSLWLFPRGEVHERMYISHFILTSPLINLYLR